MLCQVETWWSEKSSAWKVCPMSFYRRMRSGDAFFLLGLQFQHQRSMPRQPRVLCYLHLPHTPMPLLLRILMRIIMPIRLRLLLHSITISINRLHSQHILWRSNPIALCIQVIVSFLSLSHAYMVGNVPVPPPTGDLPLIYSDDTMSMEEKRAQLPRYQFNAAKAPAIPIPPAPPSAPLPPVSSN